MNVVKLAAAVSALALLTACGSGSKAGGSPTLSSSPAVGRATLALASPAGADYLPSSASGPPWADGLILTSAGTILVNQHGAQLQELDLASRSLRDVPSASDPGAKFDYGVLITAAERGGALIEDYCHGLFRQSQLGQPWTLLAGRDCDKDKTPLRGDSDPVPASEPATSALFSQNFAALGYRPDGSLMVLDGSVIWALKDGTLTRIYQASPGKRVLQFGTLFVGAVDSDGVVIVGQPSTPLVGETAFLLRDVLTVAQNGNAAALEFPSKIAGVTGDPGKLKVLSIAVGTDGAVYYRAGDLGSDPENPSRAPNEQLHQYVLCDKDGQWSVVAASYGSYNQMLKASWPDGKKDVEALKIPVMLPSAMAVLPGRLILSDGFSTAFALAVGLPG